MEKNTSLEKINKILELKKEKGALVLAHYYQNLDIQHVADFCGDSFELAKIARESDKNIIVLSIPIGENRNLAKILATILKLEFQKYVLGRESISMITIIS